MNNLKTLPLAAIALAASVSLASAQTTQDHTAHHPDGQPSAQAAQPQMPAGPRGGAKAPTTMQGQSGQAGGMGMMGGNMAQMMAMMQMMRGGMMGMDMMSAGGSSHIEGRIAFLKAELKITDAQLPQWNAFADALRSSMTALHAAMQSMMQANGRATAPDQMERQVAVLSSHLDSAKAGLAAVKPLYAALSDEQKKTADELVGEHLMSMRPVSMGMAR